jgi:hypothetical protein
MKSLQHPLEPVAALAATAVAVAAFFSMLLAGVA